VAALAVAAAPAWRAVRNHAYFALGEVVIHHRGRLPEEALRAAVAVAPGDRIWDVDAEAAAARLRALPWVRSATVQRELPDRVVVRVREYRPAAIVSVPDAPGGLYYVAANGRIFAPVGSTDGRDLPYITGLATADLDGRAGFGPRAVHRALGLIRLVGRDGASLGPVSEVHADRDRGLTLVPVRPAMSIVLGWSGFPTKLERLGRVLPLWASRAAEVREVNCLSDDQVIVRLRAPLPDTEPSTTAAGT
jgi:cell division protein FtsQ